MYTKETIITHMLKADFAPATSEELASGLSVPDSKREDFSTTLEKMQTAGLIVRLKRDRLCLPRDADLVTGIIHFRQTGKAVIRPDSKTYQATLDPVDIRSDDTGLALHGDRVVARLDSERPRKIHRGRGRRNFSHREPAKRTGRVIRILERARTSLPGTLKKARHAFYVIPDDPRIIQDILVPPPGTEGTPEAKVGDKVIVRLFEWTQRHMNPEGEIIEVLGRTHEPMAEYKAILHKFDLDPDFPDEVMQQVENVPSSVSTEGRRGRLDCRDLFTVTIDPDDAKDFDDAISLEKLEDGNWRVGVHIADVNAYVKPGSPLDIEASKRGNSTYLTGTVIPMLPHKLSNGICSLVEDEDRLTKAVFLDFTPQARLVSWRFANTVIRSNKRLTYRQAYAMMTENDLDAIRNAPLPPKHQTGSIGRDLKSLDSEEIKELRKTIRKLWFFAERLRKGRMKDGSLDLDMPEVKIYVDETGAADRIESIVNDESHQLIEEYMLAANEAVAKEIRRLGLPCLYRVHDEPDTEKLEEFREYLATVGLSVGDLTRRREITRMLTAINDHPQAYTLRIQFLRSLKQACYRASPDGHYGLCKNDYTHFTSPIRRYSDLIVHRVFENLLLKRGIDSAPKNLGIVYTQAKLESIGEHLSITERNSTDAERESVKVKLLEFFERELAKPGKKTIFDAVITDVKNHGLFIELSHSLAFGLVHISTLRDDHYLVSHDGTSLRGKRKGRTYRLGETIRVVTERVDRFKRQIDFAPAG
ncbi:MAG: RNB domain-containing ribonuclease [Verrucomicrobiota bacterium]